MVNIIFIVILVLVTAKVFHILGYSMCYSVICGALDMTAEEMDIKIDEWNKELKEIA